MNHMQMYASSLEIIRRRAPQRTEIFSIFNVVLFVLFGWSIRGFLFELPSFLLYLGLGDLTAILFYMMAFSLLESVFFTAGLVIFSMVLPSNLLKNGFAYKGFLIVLVVTIGCILFQGYYKIGFFQNFVKNDFSVFLPLWVGSIVGVIVLFVLLLLFNNKPRLQKYLMFVIEQFSIFGYIYFPLGVIGILVVFFRNII